MTSQDSKLSWSIVLASSCTNIVVFSSNIAHEWTMYKIIASKLHDSKTTRATAFLQYKFLPFVLQLVDCYCSHVQDKYCKLDFYWNWLIHVFDSTLAVTFGKSTQFYSVACCVWDRNGIGDYVWLCIVPAHVQWGVMGFSFRDTFWFPCTTYQFYS